MASSTFKVVDCGAISDNAFPEMVRANTDVSRRAGKEAARTGVGTVFTPPGVYYYVGSEESGPWCIDVLGDHLGYAGAGQSQLVSCLVTGLLS